MILKLIGALVILALVFAGALWVYRNVSFGGKKRRR